MQTVQFQCGCCGNLMAVGVEYLGQQVRCPHCQQVVIAPATTTSAPLELTEPPRMPASNGDPYADSPFQSLAQSEDIFDQPDEPTDPLFGSEEPLLELPKPVELPEMHLLPADNNHEAEPAAFKEPSEPIPPLELDTLHLPASLESVEPASMPIEVNGVSESAPPSISEPSSTPDLMPVWVDHPPTSESPAPAEAQTAAAAEAIAQKPRLVASSGTGLFLPLVFLPVLLYAVLATFFAAYLYYRLQTQPSVFDQLPDIEGDSPGVRRSKALRFDKRFATQPLAAHLIVPLGETIRVGAIQVTPLRVERRKIALLASESNPRPEPSPYDALVLHLKLRNVAEDYAFTPLDNYFDRRWDPKEPSNPPLTLLEVGKTIFFGGPAEWAPLNRGRNDRSRREWIEGRKNVDSKGLQPGEETETIVCTDAWNPETAKVLFGQDEQGKTIGKPYSGSLLWRVQLRRGLITYRGRTLSATAVVGVSFTDSAYSKGS